MKNIFFAGTILIAFILSGCVSTAHNKDVGWKGEKVHFSMSSTIDGVDYDLNITDFNKEINGSIPEMVFKREYQTNNAGTETRFIEFQVELLMMFNIGTEDSPVYEERELKIEVDNADFNNANLESPFNLLKGENEYDEDSGITAMELDGQNATVFIKVKNDDKSFDVEAQSVSGKAFVLLNTGTANSDNPDLLEGGKMGIYITGETNEGKPFEISFTADPIEEDGCLGYENETVDNWYE